jgi:hypothetical protein
MRRRLYFLVPDLPHARKIMDELLLARIDDRHIHVLAKEGTPLGDLPEARLWDRSDLKEAINHGFGVGGAIGAVGSLVALSVPSLRLLPSGALLAAAILVGAGFGAWVSGMIGVSLPNRELKAFLPAVEKGEFLMIVDVPRQRVEEIEQLVRSHHPQATFGGVEPHLPVFP